MPAETAQGGQPEELESIRAGLDDISRRAKKLRKDVRIHRVLEGEIPPDLQATIELLGRELRTARARLRRLEAASAS